MSLQQDQRLNQGHFIMLHTYTPNQCSCQVLTSYTLQFLRYSPDNIFTLKITTAKSKVKSRSHNDTAYLNPRPMSLSNFNYIHLMVSEKQPRQTFPPTCPPTHPDAMGENNTHTAVIGFGIIKPNNSICCKQSLN